MSDHPNPGRQISTSTMCGRYVRPSTISALGAVAWHAVDLRAAGGLPAPISKTPPHRGYLRRAECGKTLSLVVHCAVDSSEFISRLSFEKFSVKLRIARVYKSHSPRPLSNDASPIARYDTPRRKCNEISDLRFDAFRSANCIFSSEHLSLPAIPCPIDELPLLAVLAILVPIPAKWSLGESWCRCGR